MAQEMNYYFLLGLSVNPPEENEQVISQAIEATRNKWNNALNSNENYYRNLISMLPQIREVMLNAASRRTEARKAQQIQAEQIQLCLGDLNMVISGNRIKPAAYRKILDKYAVYGITDAQIRGKLKVPVQEDEAAEKKVELAMPDPMTMRKITKSLSILKKTTLYEVLNCKPTDSCQTLVSAAEQLYRQASMQPNKTAEVGAQQDLAGRCKIFFKDEASKQKYDNYVRYTRYPDVLERLTTIAKNNEKTISTSSYDQLLSYACDTHGISVSEAAEYIKLCCAVNSYDLGDNMKIVCASCGAENSAKAAQCIKCHKPLHVYCPKCGTDNNNVAQNCAKCHFSLMDMPRALPLIAKAKEALKQHQLAAAEQAVQQAEEFWPNHPDLLEAKSRLTQLQQQENDALSGIRAAIEKKEIVQARDLMTRARNNGIALPAEYSAHVKAVLEGVEQSISQARALPPEQAFAVILEARSHVVDHAELNAMMRSYPPDAPSQLTAALNQRSVTLQWSASASQGKVEYKVLRKQNQPPVSPADGEVVYSGSALTCGNHNIPMNQEFYYAVFALREEVCSQQAAVSNPVACVSAPTNVQYVPGDSQLMLSWQVEPSVVEMQIIREGSGAPSMLVNVHLNNVTDTELENGHQYTYQLNALHKLNGHIYRSEAAVVKATPMPDAKPILDLAVTNDDILYNATWTQDAFSEVHLMILRDEFPAPGARYSTEQAEKLFEPLTVTAQQRGRAAFQLDDRAEIFIAPFVLRGSFWLAGKFVRIVNIPKPRSLKAEIIDQGTICLNVSPWPNGARSLRVVYRTDRMPESPDDPMASFVSCMKDKYHTESGVMLRKLPFGTYHFAVYAENISHEGDRLFSAPAQTVVSLMPVQKLLYSVNWKKAFFSKSGTITVEISTTAPEIPPFVILQKVNTPPLNRGAGEVLYASSETLAQNRLEISIPWTLPGRNKHYIKLFLLEDSDYVRYSPQTSTPNIIG